MKRKKEMIHFSGRKHTVMGIASAAMGLFEILGFIIISIISGLAGGKGGAALGVAGILLFCMAVAGFLLSYRSFKKKDIFYRFPVMGMVMNGFMIIFLLIIYMLGISL